MFMARCRGAHLVVSEAIQVVTTAATRDDLVRIAERVVTDRLAACVQIEGPVTSIYRWQGRLETAEEWRCTIKSLRSTESELVRVIREIHPYELAEIITLPILGGSPAYLEWVETEIKGDA